MHGTQWTIPFTFAHAHNSPPQNKLVESLWIIARLICQRILKSNLNVKCIGAYGATEISFKQPQPHLLIIKVSTVFQEVCTQFSDILAISRDSQTISIATLQPGFHGCESFHPNQLPSESNGTCPVIVAEIGSERIQQMIRYRKIFASTLRRITRSNNS